MAVEFSKSNIFTLFVKICVIFARIEVNAIPSLLGTVSAFNSSTNSSVIEFTSQKADLNFNHTPCDYWDEFFALCRYEEIKGAIISSIPEDACSELSVQVPPKLVQFYSIFSENMMNGKHFEWILIANEQGCTVQTKINNGCAAGFNTIIIYRNYSNETENLASSEFPCSMQAFSVGHFSGVQLKENFNISKGFYVVIVTILRTEVSPANAIRWMLTMFTITMLIFVGTPILIIWCINLRARFLRCRRHWKSKQLAKTLTTVPKLIWTAETFNNYDNCVICLEHFVEGDTIRILSCSHGFHSNCIDAWLVNERPVCPICMKKFKYCIVPNRTCEENGLTENHIEIKEGQTVDIDATSNKNSDRSSIITITTIFSSSSESLVLDSDL